MIKRLQQKVLCLNNFQLLQVQKSDRVTDEKNLAVKNFKTDIFIFNIRCTVFGYLMNIEQAVKTSVSVFPKSLKKVPCCTSVQKRTPYMCIIQDANISGSRSLRHFGQFWKKKKKKVHLFA